MSMASPVGFESADTPDNLNLDEWLDRPSALMGDPVLSYVHFWLHIARLPAWQSALYRQVMAEHKLYVTYAGHRYRVTGASRYGDIWLARDLDRTSGYDLRIPFSLVTLTNWGPTP